MRRFALASILAGLAFWGCGSGNGASGGPDGVTGDTAGEELPASEALADQAIEADSGQPAVSFELPAAFVSQELNWNQCVLNDYTGEGLAECADIQAPLHWDDPAAAAPINIRLKRLLALQPGSKILWLLQGGPGAPGTTTMGYLMQRIRDRDPSIDVYTVDHRGTGESTYMGCPEQEAEDSLAGGSIYGEEWTPCIEYLKNEWLPTEAFSVTAAARDVGLAVEMASREDKDNFVMGISYGTYWAHRYAQNFPNQSKGVILDSVIPSGGFPYDVRDLNEYEVTRALFELCAEDDSCSEKLSEDPLALAEETFFAFRDGQHCQLLAQRGLDPASLQYMAAQLATFYWHGRPIVPALYYRLARCEEQDVNALMNAAVAFFAMNQISDVPGYS